MKPECVMSRSLSSLGSKSETPEALKIGYSTNQTTDTCGYALLVNACSGGASRGTHQNLSQVAVLWIGPEIRSALKTQDTC